MAFSIHDSNLMVERILRNFAYPPDMQKLATETVLQQAGHITDELTWSHR
ncbi:MAG: DUF3387 domain-containing protein [Candidatus Electrothrix sp. AR5]|nr:DUF3387 domain-containing protein [Candidatus Electrothrix sp. AR5]